jgi:UDPglucose--hexose-1-phosphate uridylyltransferase
MVYEYIQSLIDYSIQNELIHADDEIVIRNQLMEALRLDNWQDVTTTNPNQTIDEILEHLIAYAVENSIIEDTTNSRDLFDTKLMGIVTPKPHEINSKFFGLYSESPQKATDWYYQYNKDVNYVRYSRISRDLKWKYQSKYGELDITINRSKPEKDPRDIAKAKTQQSVKYPKCQLCAENMGFQGNLNHPARQNLRPIPVTINGEKWYLQYSPYGYYNEHSILFNGSHVPMVIDKDVFNKLFDAVETLPHYFFGSNADLPIVGGSILSHEHFQGGNYTFAMAKAPIVTEVTLKDYPNVSGGIVKWAMSVVRLQSTDKEELSGACNLVLQQWKQYDDPSVDILSHTGDTPHNTITPIVRMVGDQYQCDLVLRNNRTSEERPMGIFHPNESLHHIKKENIGLIEVMGLAVLPSRLATELQTLKTLMLAKEDLYSHPEVSAHAEWANDILNRYPNFSQENAQEILELEVGKVFEEVLQDAGVFKDTAEGREAFLRFIDTL